MLRIFALRIHAQLTAPAPGCCMAFSLRICCRLPARLTAS